MSKRGGLCHKAYWIRVDLHAWGSKRLHPKRALKPVEEYMKFAFKHIVATAAFVAAGLTTTFLAAG